MVKIIRISERFIKNYNDIRIKTILEGVEAKMRSLKGLNEIQVLIDTENPNRYLVETNWKDRDAMNEWLNSETCKNAVAELEKVLDRPTSYREFVRHEDDVFLL